MEYILWYVLYIYADKVTNNFYFCFWPGLPTFGDKNLLRNLWQTHRGQPKNFLFLLLLFLFRLVLCCLLPLQLLVARACVSLRVSGCMGVCMGE